MTLREPSDSICPTCKMTMVDRPAYPYPVISQALFGISFLLFMFFFQKAQESPLTLWTWTVIQVVLGMILIRGRIRARKREYRCIRCTSALR
jgi:hypothetical protein